MERSPYPRMAVAVLALLGFFDAAYLSVERLRNGAVLICPTGGGCTIVQNSSYSVLFGLLPLAYLGVLAYVGLLALALLALQRDDVAGLPTTGLLLAAASIGVLFSAYLSYLQVAVIGAICFWCVMSALIELSIWIAALIDWRAYRRNSAASAGARGWGLGARN